MSEPLATHVAVTRLEELIDLRDDAFHLVSKTASVYVADPVAWVLGEREHSSPREVITTLMEVVVDGGVVLADTVSDISTASRS